MESLPVMPGPLLEALNDVWFRAHGEVVREAMRAAGQRNQDGERCRVTPPEVLAAAEKVVAGLLPQLQQVLNESGANYVRRAS